MALTINLTSSRLDHQQLEETTAIDDITLVLVKVGIIVAHSPANRNGYRLDGLVEKEANSFMHLKLQLVFPDKTHLTLMHRFVGPAGCTTVDIFKRSWVGVLTHYLTTFIDTGVSYQTPL